MVEDEYSAGVDGLDPAPGREGIASRYGEEKREAKCGALGQQGTSPIGVTSSSLLKSTVIGSEPRSAPAIEDDAAAQQRRPPTTDHVGLQILEGGFRLRNDWLVHNPYQHDLRRSFGTSPTFAGLHLPVLSDQSAPLVFYRLVLSPEVPYPSHKVSGISCRMAVAGGTTPSLNDALRKLSWGALVGFTLPNCAVDAGTPS